MKYGRRGKAFFLKSQHLALQRQATAIKREKQQRLKQKERPRANRDRYPDYSQKKRLKQKQEKEKSEITQQIQLLFPLLEIYRKIKGKRQEDYNELDEIYRLKFVDRKMRNQRAINGLIRLSRKIVANLSKPE